MIPAYQDSLTTFYHTDALSGCTTVRINDRGPFVAGLDLDLSEAAAESIGLSGVEPVEIAGTSEPVTELPATGGEK